MPRMQSAPAARNFEVPPLGVSCDEWSAVCQGRCNLLLEGSRASTEAALLGLMPHLRGIVQWKQQATLLDLPPSPVRTLIVREVSDLQATEQKNLDDWVAAPGYQTQIISTTAQPLFSLVKRGLFDERLYYRLNAVLIHLE